MATFHERFPAMSDESAKAMVESMHGMAQHVDEAVINRREAELDRRMEGISRVLGVASPIGQIGKVRRCRDIMARNRDGDGGFKPLVQWPRADRREFQRIAKKPHIRNALMELFEGAVSLS